MKFNRHSKILEIIDQKNIETQEELAEELRAAGFDITQATVSRDIKELRLVKVLTPDGIYKYATIDKEDTGITQRLIRVFAESVISMDYANNLIIIKTISAGAQAAASTIDALNWHEIVGCIAGDDTILIVVRENDMVEGVMKRFKKLLKE